MHIIIYDREYLLEGDFPSSLSDEINWSLINFNQINIITPYLESCEINQTNNISMWLLLRNM